MGEILFRALILVAVLLGCLMAPVSVWNDPTRWWQGDMERNALVAFAARRAVIATAIALVLLALLAAL